jgi:hypothetical protein
MDSYYTLISSLPQLPRDFEEGEVPITAATLRRRLSMLDHEHRRIVQQLSDFFRWDRQPPDRTDAEIRATYQRLIAEIRNPLVARLVKHRIEMRTLVAAVRCQRGNLPPPELPALPLSLWIHRHWDQPGFRLSARFDWLPRFCLALDDNQLQEAQRRLFAELWKLWSRLDQHYHFSFESVVLYLARWEILHRWASQDALRGQQRFDDLVDEFLRSKMASLQGIVPT